MEIELVPPAKASPRQQWVIKQHTKKNASLKMPFPMGSNDKNVYLKGRTTTYNNGVCSRFDAFPWIDGALPLPLGPSWGVENEFSFILE